MESIDLTLFFVKAKGKINPAYLHASTYVVLEVISFNPGFRGPSSRELKIYTRNLEKERIEWVESKNQSIYLCSNYSVASGGLKIHFFFISTSSSKKVVVCLFAPRHSIIFPTNRISCLNCVAMSNLDMPFFEDGILSLIQRWSVGVRVEENSKFP